MFPKIIEIIKIISQRLNEGAVRSALIARAHDQRLSEDQEMYILGAKRMSH